MMTVFDEIRLSLHRHGPKDLSRAGKLYDAYYFAHECGPPYERKEGWQRFFSGIAERIVRDLRPSSVLDVGCAMGFLVEALRERGVEAYGLDISEYAIERVNPDIQPYCRVGSILDPFPQRYDLLVCIEVLEHLPSSEADRAIGNCCSHSNDILFSSTPFDYKELSHFNVQPPEYWAEIFARHSFLRDVDYDASFVTPWATRFRHNLDSMPRVVRDYERKYWLLQKENLDLRDRGIEIRNQLASDEETIQSLKIDCEKKNRSSRELEKTLEVQQEQIKERDQAVCRLEGTLEVQQKQLKEREQVVRGLEETLQASDARIAGLSQETDLLRNQLQGIHESLAWQLVRSIHDLLLHIAPPQSWRARLLLAWKRTLMTWMKGNPPRDKADDR